MIPSSSIRTPSSALRAPQKTVRGPYSNDISEVLLPSYSHVAGERPPDTTRLSPLTSSFPSQSLTVNAAPPPERRGNSSKSTIEPYSDFLSHKLPKHNPPPFPLDSDSDQRIASDDNIGLFVFHEKQLIPNAGDPLSEALQSNVPTEGFLATSGLDKHRSHNSGLPLSPPKLIPFSASSNHSPGYLESSDYFFKERPSSPNDSIYSNPSAAGLLQNGHHSRSSSIHANVDDTVVMISPSSVKLNLDSSNSINPLPIHGEAQGQLSNAALSPTDINVQKRSSSTPNISVEGCRSTNASRSASPAYRADVPHSVESDTENENENDIKSHSKKSNLPPAPPPKDSKGTRPIPYDTEADLDTSETSQLGDVSEDLLESLRVERMSHSTFIAPALPPIRFSLNTSDFSELLGSVGGVMSLKSLDEVAMLARQKQDDNALTTPPSPIATLDTSKKNAALPLSGISDNQGPITQDASLAILSSRIHDDEPSGSSNPSIQSDQTQITITEPESNIAGQNAFHLIYTRLQETSSSAKKTGAQHLHVDIRLIDAIIELIESQKAEYHSLTGKVEGMNVGNLLFFHCSLLKLCRERVNSMSMG